MTTRRMRSAWLAIAGSLALGVAGAGDPAAPAALISQESYLQRASQDPQQLFVLDVRSAQEFAEGHVPGAVNVPHDQLGSRLADVPKDKDLVIYCRSGRRSALAADVLKANGYTRLATLEGDMLAWLANGRPVEKP